MPNKQEPERRIASEFRVEQRDGEAPKIVGYAARFNSPSQDLGGFTETIRPGAFARTLKDCDCRALVNHDPNLVLGRNKAGTLRMSEDVNGLLFELDPPDTTCGRDVAVSMKRGDIDQCSFGFLVRSDEWREENGKIVRELLDVDLIDVSVVTYPAYLDTSCSVRAIELPAQFKHTEEKPAETTVEAPPAFVPDYTNLIRQIQVEATL